MNKSSVLLVRVKVRVIVRVRRQPDRVSLRRLECPTGVVPSLLSEVWQGAQEAVGGVPGRCNYHSWNP